MQNEFHIEALSNDNANEATKLVVNTFKIKSKLEKQTLVASIEQTDATLELYKKLHIKDMQYWVIKHNHKVIAVTGIYTEIEDNDDECWLGWFCVDKKFRNKKIGQKLLDFSITKAQELNKKVLKLYTYNSDEYIPAIELFKKNSFHQYDVKNHYLYYRYNLNNSSKTLLVN